jgi:hypothetical protein
MSNPTIVAGTKNNASIAAANTSVTVTSTGSVTIGNLQIVCIEVSGASAPTGLSPPAGWTTLLATTTTQASGLVSAAIFYKVATATGAFSGSFSWTTSSTGGQWSFSEWNGVGPANIDGVAGTTLNTSSTSPVSPTKTPSTGNPLDTLVCCLFGGVLSTSTVTIPSGMSSVLTVSGSASTPLFGMASLALTGTGATGSETWTLGTAEATLGVSFLLPASQVWTQPPNWQDWVPPKAGEQLKSQRGRLSVPFFQVWQPRDRWPDFIYRKTTPVGVFSPYLFYTESPPFPETVTESRWHQPWSEPLVKTKAGLVVQLQSYLAFVAPQVATTGTGNMLWFQPLSSVMSQVVLIGSG